MGATINNNKINEILSQQNVRFKISGYHGLETRLNVETNGYLAYFESFL